MDTVELRSGGTVAELAPAFRSMLWTTRMSGTFPRVPPRVAPGWRAKECGADGLALWWGDGRSTKDRPEHRLGLAAVPYGFSLGGPGRATRTPGRI